MEPKSVTLNDIIAFILHYSTKFGSFGANYVKGVDDRFCTKNVVKESIFSNR